MSADAKQSLLDMGFNSQKIDKAIAACGENLEQAMEWILAHADDIESCTDSISKETPSDEGKEIDATEANAEGDTNAELDAEGEANAELDAEGEKEAAAKSLKCDECGKLFRTSEEVEFHAVKSGHSSFSESTEEKRPLSAEEKQQKLKDLEEKMRQRRKVKEEEERKEVIEREKKRIQMSKEISEVKKRIADQEIIRLAEEKRREKLEDKMARQRVKDEIERDKLARKEMFGSGNKSTPAPSSSQPVASPVSSAPEQKKDYDRTRLQIRLPSGPPLVQEFRAKESLSAVRLWIGLNRKDKDPASQSFKLSTTFPRKVFTEEDMDKPLNVLGLVPSAVLVVLD